LPYQTGPDFFSNGVTQPSLSDDRNMPVLKDNVGKSGDKWARDINGGPEK